MSVNLLDIQPKVDALVQMGESLRPPAATPKPKLDVVEKLRILEQNPQYQALPQDKKIGVRTHIYDKYVSDYLRSKGVKETPQSRQTWILSGTGPQGSTKQQKSAFPTPLTTREKAETVGARFLLGEMESVEKSLKFNERIVNAIGRPFGYTTEGPQSIKAHEFLTKRAFQAEEYLQDHYSNSLGIRFAGGAAEIAGKELLHLPAYAAVGEGVALGEGILRGTAIGEELASSASPTSRFAYKALKRAADGYLQGIITTGSHKEAKESGEAFAFLGAGGDVAKGPVKYIARLLGIGGAKAVANATKAAATPEAANIVDDEVKAIVHQPRKLTDYLTKANAEYLNREAKARGAGSFWTAKPQLKVYVLNKWATEVEHAAQHIVTENPEVINAHVAQDLAIERKINPQLDTGIKQLEQLNKANGHELIATRIVEDAKVKLAKVDKNVALTQKNKLIKDIVEKMSNMSVGPGAASRAEYEIRNQLTHVVESNIGLQGRANQLTFAWSVNQHLPKQVRMALAQEMKDIYGPSPHKWDQAAAYLDSHIDKMILTGHVAPEDLRGVFRSTRLDPDVEPTVWQRQLDEEVKAMKAKKALTSQRVTELQTSEEAVKAQIRDYERRKGSAATSTEIDRIAQESQLREIRGSISKNIQKLGGKIKGVKRTAGKSPIVEIQIKDKLLELPLKDIDNAIKNNTLDKLLLRKTLEPPTIKG